MACYRKFGLIAGCWMFLYILAESAKSQTNIVHQIPDPKDFKKFVRTHTNVLVIFAKSGKEVTANDWKLFNEVASLMKGVASVVYVDCSSESKPCKKLKSSPSTFELKHYKDGEFHKVYDRKFTVKSLASFLSNPTGDTPWEEDSDAGDVVHVNTREELMRVLNKEKKAALVMFYAPWCGHCKRLKPEFASAATQLKGSATLVGMDVDKPENYVIRTEYNITGFPTLCYFVNSKFVMRFGGETTKDGIIKWINNPTEPVEAPKEAAWSDVESEVVHLTDATFDDHVNRVPSVLVMFYAPWCGHCKKMKPEYEQAAERLKAEQIVGSLAALDATKEQAIGKKFEVKGYPTVKYFKDGKFAFDVNERTADKIVEFMKNPVEPPPPPPEDVAWENVPSNVVHLDGEAFKGFCKKKKHVLVMFYAPWCGHCKKAKPEFTTAAEHFSDTKVSFAAVDCTKHAALCQTYDVSGYPTFIYFNYGKNNIKYTGGREKDDFIRFMNDPLSPLSLSPPKPSAAELWQEVDSAKNVYHLTDKTFDSVLSERKSALVMFYAPWCGHCNAMKPAYSEAASILKSNNFDGILAAVDATAEPSLQERFRIEGFPTIKYFINGVDTLTYNLGRRSSDFVAFMKNQLQLQSTTSEAATAKQPNQLSSVNEFNNFIGEHRNCLVLFYSLKECSSCQSFVSGFHDVFAQLDDFSLYWSLALVDCSDPLSQDVCRGTGPSSQPTVRVYANGQHVSDYAGDSSASSILQFIKNQPVRKVEL